MKIKDLAEIKMDGKILIKQYNEETDFANVLYQGDNISKISYDVKEMDIKYMYIENNYLKIEV